MAKCKDFPNFKERGEWVEAQFIAQALRMGFKVLKPWGDSSAYDVGVEHDRQFFRIQVKSTSYQLGSGYLCGFKPNRSSSVKYTTKTVDFFAAYVIPQNAWYVLPASTQARSLSLRTLSRSLESNAPPAAARIALREINWEN
jgi:PD-(D/E)XK endonuclease